MEFLQQLGLFFSQTVIIVVGVIAIILTFAAVAIKNKNQSEIEIDILNEKYETQALQVKENILNDDEIKKEKKAYKKLAKDRESSPSQPRAFVINFLNGDIKATQVEVFREEVTSVLLVSQPNDEVIVNVESPGGAVYGYGLAASQIDRLKAAGLKVTVCVDKIAASGGYMMACVGHKIVAAPFSIIGSIGVVAQVPNFNRLLKKYDVDYKEYTAGDYKRTVSLFGEITDKGEKKFTDQIESTHQLFKNFVGSHRPQVDINQVATGEYWFGLDALKLNLIDEIGTSDDIILQKTKTHQVIKISIHKKQKLADRLFGIIGSHLTQVFHKFTG